MVDENNIIIKQGTWKLKLVDINPWGLELSQSSEFLYGKILFCEEQVLFNNSPYAGRMVLTFTFNSDISFQAALMACKYIFAFKAK